MITQGLEIHVLLTDICLNFKQTNKQSELNGMKGATVFFLVL